MKVLERLLKNRFLYSMGKILIFSSLVFAAQTFAQDLAPVRKQVEARLAEMPITAHFDQDYAGSENPKQMLDLYLPKVRASDQPLAVIVFIHGGGWVNGDRIQSAGAVLPFVSSGNYAGVSVSYRLSNEATWPAQIHDCKAAIRWIRGNAAKYNLDPEHIGVWGSSAGGHLVSLLGTSGDVEKLEGDLGPFPQLDSRVTCVVNQCGPQDFTMPLMFREGEPITEDPAVAGLIGAPLATSRASVIEASPVTYVTSDDAPFLTLHGTKDERVDFKHAERIDKALTEAKVVSLLVPVTDGGHGLAHPDMGDRVTRFFDRYLRGMDVEMPPGALAPATAGASR